MPARRAVPLCVLLPVWMLAAGPPAIRRQGVVNSASQRPAAVGGAIGRGSRISIYGVRFAAAVDGNRVMLESGGRSRTLPVLSADPQHIESWIPADAPLGEARITVVCNGLSSAPEAITIRKAAPGLFSANGEGWGPAGSLNTPAKSVAPTGRFTLSVTGIAPPDKPEVHVGNAVARVLDISAPTNYGRLMTVQVPPNAPEGCYVPVYARVPGAPPSNTVTIPVHRGGGACVRAPEDPAAGWNGGKTAILLLSRTVRHTPDAPRDRTEDEITAGFFDVPAGQARASPLLAIPPPGVCTTWAGALKAGDPVGGSLWTLLFGGTAGQGLDAGNWIDLRNQSVQLRAAIVTGAPGLYRRSLSGRPQPVPSRNRLSLDSGRLGVAGPGGPQVGPFAVALPAPVPFTVTHGPADAIRRTEVVPVEWDPASPEGTIALVLVGSDPNLNVAGLVYCNAPKAAGRFSIPADLLAHLPAGRGSLVMASWWQQTLVPPPSGIARMVGMSVFARSFEIAIE